MNKPIEVKFFEIRDRGTCMPSMAIKMAPTGNEKEQWIMRKGGFSDEKPYCIELVFIEINQVQYDPYDWKDRTRKTAHLFIEKNFDTIESGSVVDVRYILGETEEPVKSDEDNEFRVFSN